MLIYIYINIHESNYKPVYKIIIHVSIVAQVIEQIIEKAQIFLTKKSQNPVRSIPLAKKYSLASALPLMASKD